MAIKTKSKSTNLVIPTKKTMNFVHHKSVFNPKKMIPLILVMVIVSLVFVKFGIIDFLDKKSVAVQEVSKKQEQLTKLQNSLKDYDQVADKYGRYSYGWMNEDEVNLLNRMLILGVIEEKIAPKAVIENIAINNNVISMSIHGLTLEQASGVVKDLETNSLVTSALVYNAVAQDAEEASINMNIIMAKPSVEEETEATAATEETTAATEATEEVEG